MKRRIVSILTALALCLSLCPTWALAAEGEQDTGLCDHHRSHTAECGYVQANPGTPCGYECRVCPIEDLIAALPDTVTEDNADEVRARLDEILALYWELTEDEQGQLDLSRVTELQGALDRANAPVMAEGTATPYIDADRNEQTADCTPLTSLSSSVGKSGGWYVVNGNVTIDGQLTFNDAAHLILADGCKLTVKNINTTNLTIYGQSQGTGTLIAGAWDLVTPAIGHADPVGTPSKVSITINGGCVNAYSDTGIAPGYSQERSVIGGYYNSYMDSVTINGGVVYAVDAAMGSRCFPKNRTTRENCIVGYNGVATVYGNAGLPDAVEIGINDPSIIDSLKSIYISSGATLTSLGKYKAYPIDMYDLLDDDKFNITLKGGINAASTDQEIRNAIQVTSPYTDIGHIGAFTIAGLTTEDVTTIARNDDGTCTAIFTKNGKTVTKTFSLNKGQIYWINVTLPMYSYAHTGSAIEPEVTVKVDGKVLTEGTDYTVKYTNNTNIGEATVTVTGIGNYEGTAEKTFAINDADTPIAVQYVDESGQVKTAQAKAISASTDSQTLKGGWYFVQGAAQRGTIIAQIRQDSYLILPDGCSLNVTKALSVEGNLTIYGQSGNSGKLTVKNKQTSNASLSISTGNLTVNGGNLSVKKSFGGPAIELKYRGYTFTYNGTSENFTVDGDFNSSGTLQTERLTEDMIVVDRTNLPKGSSEDLSAEVGACVTLKDPTYAGKTFTLTGWTQSSVAKVDDTTYTVTYTHAQRGTVRKTVTLDPPCAHPNLTYQDQGDGTCGGTCPDCNQEVKEPHQWSEAGVCEKCGTQAEAKVEKESSAPSYVWSLPKAFTAENSGATITPLRDVGLSMNELLFAPIPLTGAFDFTLDLAGHTITGPACIQIFNGKLTICDSSTGKTGKITTTDTSPLAVQGGTVILKGGTFDGKDHVAISGATYANLLADGYAYYRDGTPIPLAELENISGGLTGPVTVKECQHTGVEVTNLSDGKHGLTCPYCGYHYEHTTILTATASGNTVTLNEGCGTESCGYSKEQGTVSFTFENLVYGNPDAKVTFTNIPANYTLMCQDNQRDDGVTEVSWTLAELFGSTKVTAGKHTLKVSFFSNAGERSNECELDFTIDPAPLTAEMVTLGETEVTYNGQAQEPAVTVDGLTVGTDYEVSYAGNTEAGTATVTVTGKGNYTGTIEKTFQIKPATLTVTPPTASLFYGQKLSDSTLTGGTVTNSNGGGTVAGNWSWANENTQPTATENFPVAFVPSDTANYNTPENLNINVTVNPATPAITLKLVPSQQVAGGEVTVTYQVENPYDARWKDDLPSVTLSCSDPSVKIENGKFTIPANAAKDTEITVTASAGAVDGKYTAVTQTAKVTVTDRTPVTISAEAVSRTYNGQPFSISTPAAGDYQGNFTVTYAGRNGTSYNSTTAPTNAGDYTVTISLADVSVYIADPLALDFSITQASATVTANSRTITKGDPVPVYTCTISPSGANLGFTPTPSCAYTTQSGAGEYPITVDGGKVSTDGNYTITYVDGKLTVNEPVPPTPTETPVTSVRLNRSTVTLKPGEGFRLTETVEPSNATRKDVTWSSSNPTVVEVDGSGSVIAHTPGTAVITVRTVSGGHTAACTVTVEAPEPEHVHDWDSAWSRDNGCHWHECLAGGCDITVDSEKDGYGEHIYDDEQDTACNVCGYVREVEPPEPEHVHDWDSAWNRDNGCHWHECLAGGCDITVDSEKDGYGEHIYDDEQDNACNVCGYVREVEPPEPETYTITYNSNGGTGTMAAGTAIKDVPFVLPACGFMAPEGKVFDTWHIGGTSGISVKPGEQYTFTADTVVQAVWKDAPSKPEYTITGSVLQDGAGVPDAIVTLMRGTITVAAERTDANGRFMFSGVPVGTYNLKAEKDGITKTAKQEITSGSAGLTIILPNGRTNSVVEVKNDETPPVVVGGLDQIFTDTSIYTPEDQEAVGNGGVVEFKLTVEKQDAPPEAVQIETVKKDNETVALYLDLTLTKTVTHSDGTGTNAEIPEIGTLIETIIPLPAEMQGRASYTVYRVHNGVAEPLPQDNGSEYYTVSSDKTSISIFARKYSTYAIAWSDEAETPPTPPTPPAPSRPTGGGGGSSVSTYAVTIEKSEHGKVISSRTNASSGSTVTLTVTPDSGYVLDMLTVTDGRGSEIRLTAQGDGKYTITMPSRAVTVKATFAPLPDDTEKPCDGGADCPSHGFADLGTVGTWHHEAVDYVLRNGLMNGYSSTLFGPDDNLSRAQLAQILYNQAGRPAVTGGSVFTDVLDGRWYAPAITWAAANGIAGGYGNGMLGPDDDITREQLAAMLWRYAGSPAATDKELHFTDADKASGYALEALRWAAEHGILNGYGDGRLEPGGLVTRAQAAQMLKNFFGNR